jgi:hypothetical protein
MFSAVAAAEEAFTEEFPDVFAVLPDEELPELAEALCTAWEYVFAEILSMIPSHRKTFTHPAAMIIIRRVIISFLTGCLFFAVYLVDRMAQPSFFPLLSNLCLHCLKQADAMNLKTLSVRRHL